MLGSPTYWHIFVRTKCIGAREVCAGGHPPRAFRQSLSARAAKREAFHRSTAEVNLHELPTEMTLVHLSGPSRYLSPSSYHRCVLIGAVAARLSARFPVVVIVILPEGSPGLWDAGAPTERGFFPLSCVISVLLPGQGGRGLEVAHVGREGSGRPQLRIGAKGSGPYSITHPISDIPPTMSASAARQRPQMRMSGG